MMRGSIYLVGNYLDFELLVFRIISISNYLGFKLFTYRNISISNYLYFELFAFQAQPSLLNYNDVILSTCLKNKNPITDWGRQRRHFFAEFNFHCVVVNLLHARNKLCTRKVRKKINKQPFWLNFIFKYTWDEKKVEWIILKHLLRCEKIQ